MVRAYVGAGGKTTLLHRDAKRYLAQGMRVFVTTSTHMFIEEDTLLTDNADEIIRQLEEKRYVMAGLKEGEKIRALSAETYKKVCAHADVVLVEADGSAHKPFKYPKDGEPVLYDNIDEIVVVCGLHGLHGRLVDVCHRPELVKSCLQAEDDTRINASHVQKLVMKGYVEPLRKKYPGKNVKIEPCGAVTPYEEEVAACLRSETDVPASVGCVIMASGEGKRYGKNKLLESFRGKQLIAHTLDLTEGNLFARRVVVTRSPEVAKICEQRKVDVILHDLPFRNEVIRLGIAHMDGMEGCLFCPCDQPLLKKESMKNIRNAFMMNACKGIFRLAYKEKMAAPVLFSKAYFEELKNLPQKQGGSYLIRRYADQVQAVEACHEWELYDIDTKEDMCRLSCIKEESECTQ